MMFTNAIRRLTRLLSGGERGQVLIMVVGLISVFGGMTAIAVDYGSYAAHRRDLQNAADAIALAASLELPDASAAQSAADQWAVNNDIDPAQITVTIIPQNIPSQPNPEVQVVVDDTHDFYFARLIGITSSAIDADAAAIKTSSAGGDGTIPLAVTDEALNGVGLGDEVTLKYDSNDILNGNTGPVRIDGGGSGNCSSSDNYCRGVRYGSQGVICADGADPTYCTGPTVIDTQPGNLIGGTRTAIQYRIDNTDALCDEFNEVFEDDPASSDPGTYRIVPDCNPFLASSYSSLRVLIVPVIDELCNGSCSVTVVNFALFFLERIGSGGCTGNDCEVVGRFVRVNQNVGLLAGTYDPNALNSFVRLVE